jgi:transglutaminase-like putative cysteine protease
MRRIFLALLGLCIFLIPQKVFASSDFTNSFDVTYTVNEAGTTHAVFVGKLTNTADNKYATSYTLTTGFSDIENVRATDPLGPLSPVISKQGVVVTFKDHVVGKGKSFSFSIVFDTKDIARHNGDIWELNIPGIANQEDFKDFTVHLSVPSSFGQVSFIKPLTAGNSLDFDKTILGSSGISMAFGDQQSSAFTLKYHVKNANFFPITSHIALPPTTNYQTVALDDISPKPTNVVVDTDGNWIAQYTLLPSQQLTITAKGRVSAVLSPKKEKLSSQNRAIYLQPQPYWETTGSIKKLAQDLKTPDAIYQYVVNHLSYDFSRIAGTQVRLGAAQVLTKPTSAVCLEFTDLFIALARATGIPAREVDGYAFTQNQKERPLSQEKDILHAWPEYYDDTKQTWIMVDPTWQNTTRGVDYFSVLDFDHVAFVVRGVSSTSPIPAGGYKLTTDATNKDVAITFGAPVTEESQKAGVVFTTAPTLLSGFPVEGTLFIRNVGSQLIDPQEVSVIANDFTPHAQKVMTQAIPPFGFAQKTIGFDTIPILTNGTKIITIEVAGNTIKKQVHIYPVFFQKAFIIGGISFVILCIIILIIAARARRVPVSR